MSSRRGSGNPFVADSSSNQLSKGKNASSVSSPKVEKLSQDVAGIVMDSSQNDDGQWETMSRKSKNKAGSSAARSWVSQNPNSKPWGHQDAIKKPGMQTNVRATHTADSKILTGRGNMRAKIVNRGSGNSYPAPQAVIGPPLEHGWNWQSRVGSVPSETSKYSQGNEVLDINEKVDDVVNEDDDVVNEDDDDDDVTDDALDDYDDELLSDEFDSDSSQKSHDTRKKNRWFKKFFESLDSLTIQEINEPERQWHCPACQGGPGAIDWYRGLHPLITHAKTKGAQRVKLHREFAELLGEELHRRGASVIPAGEVFGQWKGLGEEKDHEIVWPPMVIIMNTQFDKDENDKWIGMGNQELLDYFKDYAAVKARHSYGPQGHRGMSILIFESSANGYLEAELLHKHFIDEGTHRDAWDNRHRRVLFNPGGKRQLYGFMVQKRDLDLFNQHCQGKSRLKFEMRSYQEMVVSQFRQMSEDNQQLNWFKNRFSRVQTHARALEESLGVVTEKLRQTAEDSRIVRQRTKVQHEENKEEMDFQDNFFKEQIKVIHEARDAKEEDFEKLQQEEREKINQFNVMVNPSNADEYRCKAEERSKQIEIQEKYVGKFVEERDKVVEAHEKRMSAMSHRHLEEEKELRRRHWEEVMEMERVFDEELACVMEKYTPQG